MRYVVDGYCYWSNLTKPNKLSRKWDLYLNVSPEALDKFKEEGITPKLIKDEKDRAFFAVRFCKQQAYADLTYPSPPIYDKEGERISLLEEIPNGLKIKVKFEQWTGMTEWGHINYMRLLAIKLLEDIPHEFDKVATWI